MPIRLRLRAILAATSLAALAACDPASPGRAGLTAPIDGPSLAATSTIPAEGTASTLDLGTWNIEWFGDASNGPSNEALQLENVRDVIRMTDLDLWGVQEVVGKPAFDNLVAQLPGYTGFLANDARVTDGAAYYSDFSNTEQKVGFVYKTAVATLQSARIILTASDYDFAGRPPLEARFTVTVNGATEDLVIIVLHAKAGATSADRTRRLNASTALKSYLDTTYPTQKVVVLGDFNDDVDTSIVPGMSSPYANFVSDAADYTFPTKALSDAGISSTVNYADAVDHHLGTNEMLASYVGGSAKVLRVDAHITSYGTTTTDHYPVASRYTPGSGSPPPANAAPVASFTSACTDLACTFSDASTDSDGTIASWSWAFGDGATAAVANPAHTYAAAGSYTVSLTVTDNGGATASTSRTVTVTAPASPIALTAKGRKVKGVQYVDLTWAGATTTAVDIVRNGATVASTPNDGSHTDNLGKAGPGTFTYKVCESGTTVCSAPASVTF